MRMDAGLDTGPVYRCERLAIQPTDTAGSLHDKLAALGAALVVDVLDEIETGKLLPRPQPDDGATYAAKISREETLLDWSRAAAHIERAVRALDPVPGAQSTLGGEVVKIWRGEPVPRSGPIPGQIPGQIIAAGEQGIVVACGAGAYRITELQRAGGQRLAAADFLRGRALAPGARFGT
jgi:methionyl-tRNA formyltransferase